ncbi:MAG: SDR family oxidoreductase [Acidimicrobiales bacterium]
MDLGLSGKRAVVAASSSGLGLACAQALAAEGATVAMGSRDKDRIEAAAAGIDGAIPLVGDVSTVEGATAFTTAAVEALGGVDILIANAGGPPPGTFASTPLATYPDALALNLLSTVAMCEVTVPAMQQQGWGRVVALTSVSVRQPISNLILSNTARAGLTGFLKTLALEVAGDGVTVNSVQPGLHATPRLSSIPGALTDRAVGVPAGRIGAPEDFGRVATFLCSESANYITGVALNVDGGSYGGLQ